MEPTGENVSLETYFRFMAENWESIVLRNSSKIKTEKDAQELVWEEFVQMNVKKKIPKQKIKKIVGSFDLKNPILDHLKGKNEVTKNKSITETNIINSEKGKEVENNPLKFPQKSLYKPKFKVPDRGNLKSSQKVLPVQAASTCSITRPSTKPSTSAISNIPSLKVKSTRRSQVLVTDLTEKFETLDSLDPTISFKTVSEKFWDADMT